jgi:hypothetical protein
MGYKALAYIGFFNLRNLGSFDTEREAFDALENELDRQQSLETDESYPETFWACSQIDEE